MHIGVLTNSLTQVGVSSLMDISEWAAANGIMELEAGPAIQMDEKTWNEAREKTGVRVGTMIYCRNFLSSDPEDARKHIQALRERIEFSGKMGVGKVVCSTGVVSASMEKLDYRPELTLEAFRTLFTDIMELAEKNHVRVCFEMCPWMFNVACAPNMWDQLFEAVPSENLGLCFDPSHLVWQMIDAYQVLRRFHSKIFHVHGKDTEIDRIALGEYGILQNTKWWRHRLPGLGELDWNRIIDLLYQIGYDGVLSIEHEDPVWEGTEEKVKKGILIAKAHLEQFIR